MAKSKQKTSEFDLEAASPADAESLALVDQTWKEIGYKIRPLKTNTNIYVRTMPPPQKKGLIWLPPKLARFHGDLANKIMTRGVVVAVPEGMTGVKVGDRVCFPRLFFGFLFKVSYQPEIYFGFVKATHVFGNFWYDEKDLLEAQNAA